MGPLTLVEAARLLACLPPVPGVMVSGTRADVTGWPLPSFDEPGGVECVTVRVYVDGYPAAARVASAWGLGGSLMWEDYPFTLDRPHVQCQWRGWHPVPDCADLPVWVIVSTVVPAGDLPTDLTPGTTAAGAGTAGARAGSGWGGR